MANEEQLSILKQGVDAWNRWRKENIVDVDLSAAVLFEADLSEADFTGANLNRAELFEAKLRGAHFGGANLRKADLTGADLMGANLVGADLCEADFTGANLREANLREADLRVAILIEANLAKANLRKADLSEANLVEANLVEADLMGANLTQTNLLGAFLQGSDFSEVVAADTIFGNLDLRQVTGLDKIEHDVPSTIGTNTFARSAGEIPEIFLRGCGLSDWEIEKTKLYNPDLSNEEINKILYKIYDLRASQGLQISPLFISYSHADSEFVDKFGDCLNKKGIRYWRDIHDMKAGRMEKQINEAIRLNPTVLLVLSKNSIKSDWVEHEVRTARKLEKKLKRDTLCPVALDSSWKRSKWPERVMEQVMEYNILDFSNWEDNGNFDEMFRKLIEGLDLFYKK